MQTKRRALSGNQIINLYVPKTYIYVFLLSSSSCQHETATSPRRQLDDQADCAKHDTEANKAAFKSFWYPNLSRLKSRREVAFNALKFTYF